jgi:D-alanine-D-alanine ligase-like ATP-grasp enzyme
MKSVRGKMLCQKHTFELLGYDFIFDEELNTILIEVNTNPCLEESN